MGAGEAMAFTVSLALPPRGDSFKISTSTEPVLAVCLTGSCLNNVNIRSWSSLLHRLQQNHIDLAHPESLLAKHGSSLDGSGYRDRPRYTVYAKNPDSGYLKHVYLVLDRAGWSIKRPNEYRSACISMWQQRQNLQENVFNGLKSGQFFPRLGLVLPSNCVFTSDEA